MRASAPRLCACVGRSQAWLGFQPRCRTAVATNDLVVIADGRKSMSTGAAERGLLRGLTGEVQPWLPIRLWLVLASMASPRKLAMLCGSRQTIRTSVPSGSGISKPRP